MLHTPLHTIFESKLTSLGPALGLPPDDYPLRKTDLRGIPVVEDLVRSRNRLPPEEYPRRKTDLRGIPLWKTWHKTGTNPRLRNTP